MLAMVVNANAANLTPRGARRFIASKSPIPHAAGNKKPDIIIGLELARQAGNSLWADLTPVTRQSVRIFSPRSRQRSLLNTGCSELGRLF